MFKSLTHKILALVLITMLVGIGIVVTYFLAAQNRDLVQERENGVEQQTAVLYESIKNSMLDANSATVRNLLSDLKRVQSIREIVLFRTDGQEAFSDNATIDMVNQVMGGQVFAPSEGQSSYLRDQSALFQMAVRTQSRQVQSYVVETGRELV